MVAAETELRDDAYVEKLTRREIRGIVLGALCEALSVTILAMDEGRAATSGRFAAWPPVPMACVTAVTTCSRSG
jgi:hypothetical protein